MYYCVYILDKIIICSIFSMAPAYYRCHTEVVKNKCSVMSFSCFTRDKCLDVLKVITECFLGQCPCTTCDLSWYCSKFHTSMFSVTYSNVPRVYFDVPRSFSNVITTKLSYRKQ